MSVLLSLLFGMTAQGQAATGWQYPVPAGVPGNLGTGDLQYHGGPVIHGSTTYAIYWGPRSSWDPGYRALINRFLTDVAADSATGRNARTNIFALTPQYTDAHGPAQYSQRFGGAYADTNPYPQNECKPTAASPVCLANEQVQIELYMFITAHHLPRGMHSIYFLFTPRGVTNECAYHPVLPGNTPYAFLQYSAAETGNEPPSDQTCGQIGSFDRPNHSSADPTIAHLAHEDIEIITDPLTIDGLDAWRDGSQGGGLEIADMCEIPPAFFPRTPGYTQTINGHLYFILPAWSNLDHSCMYRMLHYAVPDLIGKTLSQARSLLRGVQLRAGVITRRSSRTVPRGHVISQHPSPGSWLRAGGRVKLTVSR
jgi:hypothetical protein